MGRATAAPAEAEDLKRIESGRGTYWTGCGCHPLDGWEVHWGDTDQSWPQSRQDPVKLMRTLPLGSWQDMLGSHVQAADETCWETAPWDAWETFWKLAGYPWSPLRSCSWDAMQFTGVQHNQVSCRLAEHRQSTGRGKHSRNRKRSQDHSPAVSLPAMSLYWWKLTSSQLATEKSTRQDEEALLCISLMRPWVSWVWDPRSRIVPLSTRNPAESRTQ